MVPLFRHERPFPPGIIPVLILLGLLLFAVILVCHPDTVLHHNFALS